jgi:hypothetical protein
MAGKRDPHPRCAANGAPKVDGGPSEVIHHLNRKIKHIAQQELSTDVINCDDNNPCN